MFCLFVIDVIVELKLFCFLESLLDVGVGSTCGTDCAAVIGRAAATLRVYARGTDRPSLLFVLTRTE